MADRLQALADDGGPSSGFTTGRLIESLEARQVPVDVKRKGEFLLRYGRALLLHGETERAIGQLLAVRSLIEQSSFLFQERFRREAASTLAIAYLRQAEERNCLEGHTPESCLLPVRGGGLHRDPSGAKKAMESYLEILEGSPDDLEARWLINLAAMVAGEHPAGVPERWRIPADLFESTVEAPALRDVAVAAGVAVNDRSGGVVLEDLTGDGLLDLMVSSWLLGDPLRFFVNAGDGRFEERTREAGLEGLTGGLNLVHADYDNDGFADVLVLRGAWLGAGGLQPNSLLRNNGDGTFTDVTEEAGLLDESPTQTAAWADYDGDGHLDLFVGYESTGSLRHPCRLFRNNGDGTFTDVADELGLAVEGMVKGVAWGDYDNDGRPDLYLSRLHRHNLLFRNLGPGQDGGWSFEDVTEQAGVAYPLRSFPTWFFDYDNDGWLDLFASGYPAQYLLAGVEEVAADYLGLETSAERPRLYRNRGDGTFEDVTVETGLHRVLYTMGSGFGDLDNDGWLDLYLGTGAPAYQALMPNRLFLNLGGERFADATGAAGVGHLQKGHGVAFGDLDNDGDQDLYAVMGGAYTGDRYPNVLFENPGSGLGSITLLLEGTTANRSAIGARLELVLDEREGGRSLFATVGAAGSFGSATLRQELGVGQAETVERLTVQWPGGGEQTFEGLVAGNAYRLRQGEPEPIPLDLPRITLASGEGAHAH